MLRFITSNELQPISKGVSIDVQLFLRSDRNAQPLGDSHENTQLDVCSESVRPGCSVHSGRQQ